MADRPHVTYILDRNFATPTLVSAWSLLSRHPADIDVLLLFTEPVREVQARVDGLARAYPDASVEARHLTELDHGHKTRGHVSAAAMARLLLPDILDRRTLYIDGDTWVRRDIGEIFHTDLGDCPVAAIRDPGIQKALAYRANGSSPSRKSRKHLGYLDKCTDLFSGDTYVNSGVMLFDLPAIRAMGFEARMRDVAAAVELRESRNLIFNDQTWLNVVFNGRIHFLPPEWNAFWGNKLTAKKPFGPAAQEAYAASREDPAIIHFVGRINPWEVRTPVFYPKRQPWLGRYLKVLRKALADVG